MEISLAAAGNFTLACPGGDALANPSIQDLTSSTVKVGPRQLGCIAAIGWAWCPTQRSQIGSRVPGDPLLTTLPFPASQVTVFVGIDAATQVPYGAGGSLDIPANATKVNVETANWWAGLLGLPACTRACCGGSTWLHSVARLMR
jgi:hypothetical protein